MDVSLIETSAWEILVYHLSINVRDNTISIACKEKKNSELIILVPKKKYL